MKVTIFHELLVKLGGAERIAKVFADMFPDAPIYTLLYDEKKVGSVFPRERVIVPKSLQRWYKLGVPRRMLIGKMPTAVESFNFDDYDLVLSSSSAFAHGALTNTETKHLCYCHSPARYLWDQTNEVLKQQAERGILSPIKSWLMPKLFHTLRLWDYSAAERPDHLIANSKTVQERIQHYWNRESSVVFPAVDVERFTPTAEHDDYFLIVSALSPFKNIDGAIRAFNELPKHTLVIIGDGAERDRLQKLAKKNILFLGRRSDAEVQDYIERCRAFLFPSFDDFGIAPVEAMAAGKPVLALRKGGATETVVEGKTGLFFDTSSEQAIKDTLMDFFLHEQQFDAKTIRKHAEQFDTKHFVQAMEREIEEVVKR